MGTITFPRVNDVYGSTGMGMAWSYAIADITVSNSSFTIPLPVSISATGYIYNTNAIGSASASGYLSSILRSSYGNKTVSIGSGSHSFSVTKSSGWSSKSYAVSAGTSEGRTINTSAIFDSGNKHSRTVTFSPTNGYWNFYTRDGDSWEGITTGSGSITVTLNAPPTFKILDNGGTETTHVWFDTPYVYAGFTTASIRVRNLSAKYGGYISKIQFNIGAQSQVLNFDEANPPGSSETLSILLGASGTFTPTVTVTDSRGQTATTTLSSIMVNAYSAPAVSFVLERTKSTGVPDDEGTYAAFPATFTFTDAIATLAAPTVVLIDEGGTQSTPTVNWYSSRAADGTLSGSVTWANLSSGDTVYGRVSTSGGLNTQKSYQIKITPNDDLGTGTPIIQTLAPAFYTVDFLAGGHGIAFGKPATVEGFECDMDAIFDDAVLLDLSDYSTAGTTDKAIYDAVVTLGWDSDVLVN